MQDILGGAGIITQEKTIYDEERDNARGLIAAKSVVSVKKAATLHSVSPVLNVYCTEIAEFCAATYNQR